MTQHMRWRSVSSTGRPHTSVEMHLGTRYLKDHGCELNLGPLQIHIATSRAWNRG